MRFAYVPVLLFLPTVALGQAPDTTSRKKETLYWVLQQQDPTGGFYASPKEPGTDAKPQPSLRATSAAVRAIKYLGGEIPNLDKHSAFVLKCFDPKTGGFAEPGGKPDVGTTSVGVMAAVELGITKDEFSKAMEYLKENAKTFEDVRIGAAAVEAWGVKACPFKLDQWQESAKRYVESIPKSKASAESPEDGVARDLASWVAFELRLELKTIADLSTGSNALPVTISNGQRLDGGWSKKGEKSSDIESTYRVMRSLMLLKEKPKDIPALRKFVESHHNKDGGYAVKPGDKSTVGGVYYAIIVSKWLDEMTK
jgi:prenyltransferase beta subunit